MNTNAPARPPRLIPLRDIIAPHGRLGISRSSFYAGIAASRYPRPVKLGNRSAWIESEIEDVITRLADERTLTAEKTSSLRPSIKVPPPDSS
ncbi:MAG: AlpA family phage regulatory protein [Beijerinckiaceae bacterium]|nr:AlpA family phage regulatory protein [Beijerinckiaceae bacterium]